MLPALNTPFEAQGYIRSIIKRDDDIVLLKVFAGEHYEVCFVQLDDKGDEYLPYAASWGKMGWSFMSLAAADTYYTHLRNISSQECRKRSGGIFTLPR